jgi:predicted  nucleic acid-binding Zn-ribbon protein
MMSARFQGTDRSFRAVRDRALDPEEEMSLLTRSMQHVRVRALGAIAALALAAVPACQSSGVERSQATQATMAEFKTHMLAFQTQLDATLESLDGIQKQAKVDPKAEFAKYTTNLEALNASAEKAKGMADEIRSRGNAYFTEWEKSASGISNEDIKKISDERRVELQKTYKELQDKMAAVAADGKPLRQQLNDLQKYYSQDLTEKGIDATKSTVASAKASASKLVKGLKDVLGDLEKVATQLKVAAPPPPPPDNKSTEKK